MTTYKAGYYYPEWRGLERLTNLDRAAFDELLVQVFPPSQGMIVAAWQAHNFHVHGGYARLPIATKPVRKWDDYSGPRIKEEPKKDMADRIFDYIMSKDQPPNTWAGLIREALIKEDERADYEDR